MQPQKKLALVNRAPQSAAPPTVLLVDDDELLRMLLSAQLAALGYQVVQADGVEAALGALTDGAIVERLDAVVLDRGLGDVDGLVLARQMKEKAEWRHIPVVMLTAKNDADAMCEGLEAGVFYYLGKPAAQDVLALVVELACRESSRHRTMATEMRKHRAAFTRLDSAKFGFSTLTHVEELAYFVANCFPDPARVLTGVAELMINAVEHGMFAIGYEEKGRLVAAGAWREEIERRERSAEHITKQCEIIFTRRAEGCYISVRDPGKGFNWRDYVTFDSSRAGDLHGRGIAQAASSFDKLAYNAEGNEAVGFMGQEARPSW